MNIDPFANDLPALEYIAARGYASYSSLKNVRDCQVPYKSNAAHFVFGSELHSRFLENAVVNALSEDEEIMLSAMLRELENSKLVRAILETPGIKKEQKISGTINDVPVLGYIDIDSPKILADLKTTSLTTIDKFSASMDFLQAALYLRFRPKAAFYYIGITKSTKPKLLTFSTTMFPARLRDANLELDALLIRVKEFLKEKAETPIKKPQTKTKK